MRANALRNGKRASRGQSLPECAAALSLLLPLALVIVFATLEASHAFVIQNSLTEAARQAARGLALAYADDANVGADRSLQESMVFDSIRINKVIADSAQFADPEFDTSVDPPVVSVSVQYTGGQYGLPQFPVYDPLNLGAAYQLSSSATWRL